jgi:hypothetical protein
MYYEAFLEKRQLPNKLSVNNCMVIVFQPELGKQQAMLLKVRLTDALQCINRPKIDPTE